MTIQSRLYSMLESFIYDILKSYYHEEFHALIRYILSHELSLEELMDTLNTVKTMARCLKIASNPKGQITDLNTFFTTRLPETETQLNTPFGKACYHLIKHWCVGPLLNHPHISQDVRLDVIEHLALPMTPKEVAQRQQLKKLEENGYGERICGLMRLINELVPKSYSETDMKSVLRYSTKALKTVKDPQCAQRHLNTLFHRSVKTINKIVNNKKPRFVLFDLFHENSKQWLHEYISTEGGLDLTDWCVFQKVETILLKRYQATLRSKKGTTQPSPSEEECVKEFQDLFWETKHQTPPSKEELTEAKGWLATYLELIRIEETMKHLFTEPDVREHMIKMESTNMERGRVVNDRGDAFENRALEKGEERNINYKMLRTSKYAMDYHKKCLLNPDLASQPRAYHQEMFDIAKKMNDAKKDKETGKKVSVSPLRGELDSMNITTDSVLARIGEFKNNPNDIVDAINQLLRLYTLLRHPQLVFDVKNVAFVETICMTIRTRRQSSRGRSHLPFNGGLYALYKQLRASNIPPGQLLDSLRKEYNRKNTQLMSVILQERALNGLKNMFVRYL